MSTETENFISKTGLKLLYSSVVLVLIWYILHLILTDHDRLPKENTFLSAS